MRNANVPHQPDDQWNFEGDAARAKTLLCSFNQLCLILQQENDRATNRNEL